jgi:lactoylglutathione lyase
MSTWVGQYCIYVSDLERSVAFYEALGIPNASRTEIDQAQEAVMANNDKGGRLQLAMAKPATGAPIEMGNAFWKLYVATNDIDRMFADAVAAGAEVESEPVRTDQWPMTIAFLRDPDGYLVELTQRHPWPDDATTYAWLNQYCVYVSDLDATVAWYEAMGLTCTSRTDIPAHREAIVEHPDRGGKIQLAQQLDHDGPIDMGTSMWKLYLSTDDCAGLHATAVDRGSPSVMEPTPLDRWPVTVAFVNDPDGYLVELVEKKG